MTRGPAEKKSGTFSADGFEKRSAAGYFDFGVIRKIIGKILNRRRI